MKVKCIRNDSKSLPYTVNAVYQASDIGGGMFSISDGKGRAIIAPLDGHYLEFLIAE